MSPEPDEPSQKGSGQGKQNAGALDGAVYCAGKPLVIKNEVLVELVRAAREKNTNRICC